MKPRKIIIIDGYPILREAFASFIGAESDLEVCGQADSADRALTQIAVLQPDVVILDIAYGGFNGLDLIRQIKAIAPEVAVLALSSVDETVYAERALRAGAGGYVMKQAPKEEVMIAIRKVASGERYLSQRMQERMLEHFATGSRRSTLGVHRLTDRELEVFKLIGTGFSTREIAEKLKLSTKTVETYRAHLKEKLGLRNGLELVRMALQGAQLSEESLSSLVLSRG